jgi:GMP synthase (glutamine-hydrolysing)
MSGHQTLVVLDFGSQVTQLIARRVRELGVFAEILPYHTPVATLRAKDPRAIILSGGPSSLSDEGAPQLDPAVLELGVPVLGICYGLYLLVAALGGTVVPAKEREYGAATLTVDRAEGPLARFTAGEWLRVWMSHGDRVSRAAAGLSTASGTRELRVRGGVAPAAQPLGRAVSPRGGPHASAATTCWRRFSTRRAFVATGAPRRSSTRRSRRSAGGSAITGTVLCGLSGGVDSSVAALLVERAIGPRLRCIFVDNGLLRKDERAEVESMFAGRFANPVVAVDASDAFFNALAGVTDPEIKRKRIGAAFIDVFEAEAQRLGGADFLVQGTLYPDVIESVNLRGASVTIKTHHNVGGLPERMRMGVVEPLRELFKDEVRRLGESLGMPETLVWRHPFPGPGLAVRVLGEVTRARCDLLRAADAIVIEEVRAAGLYRELWQVFGVLLPVQSVGVMGDNRTYENALAIRAVTSTDAMTADWARLPYDLLDRMSRRIINEVRGINRVCYDISSKPPATIEWE